MGFSPILKATLEDTHILLKLLFVHCLFPSPPLLLRESFPSDAGPSPFSQCARVGVTLPAFVLPHSSLFSVSLSLPSYEFSLLSLRCDREAFFLFPSQPSVNASLKFFFRGSRSFRFPLGERRPFLLGDTPSFSPNASSYTSRVGMQLAEFSG